MSRERNLDDPQYKAWRTAVFSKDKGLCRVCGRKGEEAHHIVAWAKDPSKRYDVNNGITLCKPCHEKTGSYYNPKAKFSLKNVFKLYKANKPSKPTMTTNIVHTLENDSPRHEKAQAIEVLMDNMKRRYIDEGAVAWYKMGEQLHDADSSKEALKCYDKALEVDPTYIEAWVKKGDILCLEGVFSNLEDGINEETVEEGIQCYNNALSINPYYVSAWHRKAEALMDLGRYEEAIEWYDKELDIYPDFVFGLYYKGCALHELSRYQEAIHCFDEVLVIASHQAVIHPHYRNALYWKGKALHELGCYEEAKECTNKAEALRNK